MRSITILKWFSLRDFLLDVHLDLLKVHVSWNSYVDMAQLTLVEKLVLVLEDRRFFNHYGIDLRSFLREISKACLGLKHGGASTVDMQWVRTCTGYKERSINRKIYEAFLALIIQQRYNKLQILRCYLECAYFGTRLKGIEEASLSVFRKGSFELNLEEAAEIASMLVYPRPSVLTPTWQLKIVRRKNYAVSLYPRYEKSFEKLPVRKIW